MALRKSPKRLKVTTKAWRAEMERRGEVISDESVDDFTRPCSNPFCSTVQKQAQFPFVMMSMLDLTEYACSKPCFDRWRETHPPEVWPTRNSMGNCA